MPAESVKLIVGAEDRASQILAGIGSAVEGVEGKIGGLAKASADGAFDVRSLLEQFGGSELVSFGDQLSTVRQQLAEFNEANVEGAKGLDSMKAALVAAVAVGGFKFGQWLIGASALQEKLNDELKEGVKLTNALIAANNRDVGFEQFKIGLIENEKTKVSELKKLLVGLEKELSDKEAANQRQELKGSDNGLLGKAGNVIQNTTSTLGFLPDTGLVAGELLKSMDAIRQAKVKELEFNEEIEDSLRKQKDQLQEQIRKLEAVQEFKFAKNIRDQFAVAKQGIVDFIGKLNEVPKEKKVELKTSNDQGKAILEDLRAQVIALTKGRSAAAAYRDQLRGIDAPTSKAAQGLRDQIEALTEAGKIIDKNKDAQAKFIDEMKKAMKLSIAGVLPKDELVKQQQKLLNELKSDLKNELKQDGAKNGAGKVDIQAKEDRFITGVGSGDRFTQQVDIAKQANRIAENTNKLLAENNRKLAAIAAKKPIEPKVF